MVKLPNYNILITACQQILWTHQKCTSIEYKLWAYFGTAKIINCTSSRDVLLLLVSNLLFLYLNWFLSLWCSFRFWVIAKKRQHMTSLEQLILVQVSVQSKNFFYDQPGCTVISIYSRYWRWETSLKLLSGGGGIFHHLKVTLFCIKSLENMISR